jgi:signal transduction histidine kinase/ligand-binding sensor domain-containing protein
LTIENGLSQSSVTSIYQDSRGFLWFGTSDGLNRYDGYSFKIFKNDIRNPYSISNNVINKITEDSDGNLWIATANGLNKYSPQSEKFYHIVSEKIKPSSYSEAVISVLYCCTAKEKKVWFTTSEGVNCYNIRTNKFTFYPISENQSGKNSQKLGLFKDSNNEIWATEALTGLFRLNKEKHQFERFYTDNISRTKKETWFSGLYEDKEKNLWYGTNLGLVKYNLSTGTIQRWKTQFEKAINAIIQEGFITSLNEPDDNNILLGTSGNGLFIFNKKNGTVKNIKHQPDDSRTLAHNVILTVYKDKSGILWIGTNGYGVDKLNPYTSRFNYITQTRDKLTSYSIRSIYEDIFGKIWISGYFGLDRFDPQTGKFTNYYRTKKQTLPASSDNLIYSYATDKKEPYRYLYMGTEGTGINRFDFKTNLFKKIYPGKNDNLESGYKIITALIDNGDGYLWIGTYLGLVKFNKTTEEIKIFKNDPNNPRTIGPETITYMFEDSKGNFWIGTNLGGLSLMNKKDETFRNYRFNIKDKYSLSGNFVKCIYEDSKKNLWIATTNGLNKLLDKNGKFKHYSIEDGLPNNVVYSVLEDYKGYLWLSTNNGLSKFDPVKESFKNYDVRDGLQSNEFNSYAFCKTHNGVMYFGGIKGYNFFNPINLVENKVIPRVVITDLLLFNKPVTIGKQDNGRTILTESVSEAKTIRLNHQDNVITLLFSALDYSSAGKNNYRYILEGFDKQWSLPSSKRTVTYTNLDPGEYTFKVIGSNNDGTWNYKGASLKIIIEPPFWQTWWFIALAAFAAAQSVFMLYKWRLKRVEKINKLLERQVKERTAELNKLNNSLQTEVTERKSAEEELQLINAQKDKFFSIIAHDLKSPFHGILGYAEILAEDYKNLSEEERITFINDIHNISKSTFRFLENLLEWSRIQTDRIEFEPQVIDLNQEIFEIFNILFAFAMQKNISLHNDVEPGISVFADINMLSLILRNLLSNAIKFTDENGKINITSSVNGKYVEISVTDNGIGISPENQAKLFRIDTQYTTKGTKNEEGTGLGLLLCKEMIEINKGTIHVESKIGKGTSFIFTLPKESPKK